MKGFDQVKSKLNATPKKTQTAGEEALVEVGKKIFDASQSMVPVDTGKLRASATMEESKSGGDLIVTIAYTADYALYVHEILGNVHASGSAKYLETPFLQHALTLQAVIQSKIGGLS